MLNLWHVQGKSCTLFNKKLQHFGYLHFMQFLQQVSGLAHFWVIQCNTKMGYLTDIKLDIHVRMGFISH